ncbi:uncharacterized protein [Linepithema humile]|uniref:uncharacterized protein isoform X1 n=1 Tax=Linepithema humile TaxID=83485 RepID=UPI00351EDB33
MNIGDYPYFHVVTIIRKTNMSFFNNLPNELLIMIFNLCDVSTLSKISMVCKKFHGISNMILHNKTKHLLVTNQKSKKFLERCKPQLSYIPQFIMNYNWRQRIYKDRQIEKFNPKSFLDNRKRLQMTKNMVLLCNKHSLFAYNRANDGTIKMGKKAKIFSDSPFRDFFYSNNEIISGHEDGSIRHWIIESLTEKNDIKHLRTHYNVHDNIRHIDATLRHIISGSSNSIKIQKYTYKNSYGKYLEYLEKKRQISYNNEREVQSMLFDPTGTKFAVSTYTKNPEHLSSLLIYDIDDRDSVIDKTEDCSNYRYKPGAFQLLWEDPHTILICYDSYIKKMDIRTSEFVRTWNCSSENNEILTCFTTDKILTCFTTDNLYTIMTGTTNNQVLLWDQRQNAYIQAYTTCTRRSIISIEFDSSHLYTVTDKYLCQYDFQERFGFRDRKYILSNFFK